MSYFRPNLKVVADMRSWVFFLFVLLHSFVLKAQEFSQSEEIAIFLGADSEEDIDSYEAERLMDLKTRPLRLNMAVDSKLLSSGLFTVYQIASLKQYRSTCGDILSYSELAAIDGFGEDFVRRIAPFISLESSLGVGQVASSERRVENDLAARVSYKQTRDEPGMWNYGMKYRAEVGENFSGALSFSRAYGDPAVWPSTLSGHLSWEFRRYSAKVTIGDYNARFGQGLALWNGMVLSGIHSPSSYMRRSSGISDSWSFTGSSALRGIASSIMFGRLGLSAVYVHPGTLAQNVSWYLRNGQVSATNLISLEGIFVEKPAISRWKTAMDAKVCLAGVDLFAETAYDCVGRSAAALAGTVFPLGDDARIASMLRYYPAEFSSDLSAAPRSGSKCSNEYSFSFSGETLTGGYVSVNGAEGFGSSVRKHEGVLSFDATYFPESKSKTMPHTWQFKAAVSWKSMLYDWLCLDLRVKERYRNWDGHPFKTDLRLDLKYISRNIYGTLRLNLVKVRSPAFLSYLEGGYKQERFTFYLRQGFFLVDDWESRIYVYERDAPGSFNVPACYGRGVWTAATVSWRFAGWGRLYARAGLTAYPFMEKKKPGKAELKLQYVLSF